MSVVMTPEIRRRRDGDLPSCVDAMRLVHEADGYPARWPEDATGFLTPSDVLDAWVAVDGEAVVGQVLLRDGKHERDECADEEVDLPDGLASISRLFVTPAARGTGTAARLVGTCVAEARRRGLGVILSVVEGVGDASGFYERLGWRFITTRPAEWRLPNGDIPTMRYYRQPG
ncbi:GCN5-related N-acetyltransferase [Stackebrandtia nassauensis DSM 44728]|uniref:GCN5-related N-acetyltransferase n=2 Tax=Stackebrandtia TaxID=283810 RepID=D3QAG2_STANL|nr:GCN5-related N-acetyltransferase [Stackebrandtia nassauensis DSM 44728]